MQISPHVTEPTELELFDAFSIDVPWVDKGGKTRHDDLWEVNVLLEKDEPTHAEKMKKDKAYKDAHIEKLRKLPETEQPLFGEDEE